MKFQEIEKIIYTKDYITFIELEALTIIESMNTPPRWDLNDFYEGSGKESLLIELENIKVNLAKLKKVEPINFSDKEITILSGLVTRIEKAESFYYCLSAESMDPSFLTTILLDITSLKADVRIIITYISKEKNSLQNSNEIQISSLTMEALRGYEDIYLQLHSQLQIKVEEKELSFSEANHIAMKHSDSEIRNKVFHSLNETLKKQSNLFASVYNQMIGLRQKSMELTGLGDCLEESIKNNGLSLESFHTMWSVVDENLPLLTKFLEKKVQESNKDRLTWHELMSPSQDISHNIGFSEAAVGIIDALEKIDPEISKFIIKAISNGWVDALPRESKPRGGMCIPFLTDKQSRITLYYDESFDSARILAHELGHAWHYLQLNNKPSLSFLEDRFEMTVAETSSIFFETVYIDFMIQRTNDLALKKSLVGWKIERSLNYVMSIRGAYLFEKRFNEARKVGPLNADEIEALSLQSKKEAYGESLSSYEPYVWLKYDQFYQTDIPFYNYPYTFGFLLSLGLLELAKEQAHFSIAFQNFLRETGTSSVEKLVLKHFGINLSKPSFWQKSLDRLISDIELYASL
ncbi:hypothetical protein BCI9360_00210 [Bacillus sp. CECT 9360]|nr:hypothetical protein BCI9360_00210 [Bacillus sp. CECT 9360]